MQRGSIDPLQAFQRAAAFHAEGRLLEAERLYQLVVKADDRHYEALYRLGLIRLQQGKFVEALALFRRAIKANRNSADAHHHLAIAFTALDRLDDAVARYEKAL